MNANVYNPLSLYQNFLFFVSLALFAFSHFLPFHSVLFNIFSFVFCFLFFIFSWILLLQPHHYQHFRFLFLTSHKYPFIGYYYMVGSVGPLPLHLILYFTRCIFMQIEETTVWFERLRASEIQFEILPTSYFTLPMQSATKLQ